jgi:DNA-binding transcriptional regulator GbsR (MarR family)
MKAPKDSAKSAASNKDNSYTDLVNPEARRFVSDGLNGRMFLYFVDREVTLATAAKFYGISKQRMSYWINKMIALKVIKFARFEKQGKHSAAAYRSTHDEFQVPLNIINNSMAIELEKGLQGLRLKQLRCTIAKNLPNARKIHT